MGLGHLRQWLIEDIARFDWSLVNFGSVPDNQQTVDRCNAILRVNPNHRFVIRIWPISNQGRLPNNRYMATLWDYFYNPKSRTSCGKKSGSSSSCCTMG